MLRNIQDFVKFNNNQLADDMPETLMWKLGTYYKKKIRKHLLKFRYDSQPIGLSNFRILSW